MNSSCQVVLFTHGDLGESMLKTAMQFTSGKSILLLCLQEEDEVHVLKKKLRDIANEFDDVVILTDMTMGSPTIVAAQIAFHEQINIVSGVNLHMLIEAIQHSDHMCGIALVQYLLKQGREDMCWVNQRLEKMSQSDQEE